MGSHRRRDHKRDRKRLLPHHVLSVEEERVCMEEKRRKDRERKRLQRDRARVPLEHDLEALGHDLESHPLSPMPHHHDASPLPPSPRLDSTSLLGVPTCPPSYEEPPAWVCVEPSSSYAPFLDPATTSFFIACYHSLWCGRVVTIFCSHGITYFS